jgi:hypothetical protein
MIRAAIIFILAASFAVAAQEPRAVAEEALAAWRVGDATRLNAVAHPELKKRCRDARIVLFYVEDKEEKKKALESGSDADAVGLLCEALRAIVPRDSRVEYFDRFIETTQRGDLAIVVFESGWKSKSNPSSTHSSNSEVVLKKVGDDWRFLWSPAAQVHIDLTWDPKE